MTISRPRLFLLILLIPITLVLGIVGAFLYLFHSESGTQFLAAKARDTLGEQLSWQEVEGSLAGPLVIHGVEFDQPGLQLAAQKLTLAWSPSTLVNKHLLVDGLSAQGVQVTLSNSGEAPSGAPFDPSTLKLPLSVSLQNVQLQDIRINQPGQEATLVDSVEIDADLDNGRLALHKLVVESPQGSLSLSGNALFDREMVFDLDYRLQAPELVSSEGSLHFSGNTDAYELTLSAALEGADIPASQWQVQGSGDLKQLALQELQGKLLGGELRAHGSVEWDPLVRWDLEIDGKGLDPGQLEPDFPGEFSLSVATSGQLDANGELQASVAVERLSGRLLEYPLDLSGQLAVAGETLQIDRLALASGENRITGRGTASAGSLDLDWELNASQPGAFMPGASGHFTASGHLAGSPEAPQLQVQLEGSDVMLDTLNVPRLQVDMVAGPGQEDPLKLSLESGPIQDGNSPLLESLQIQADGTTSRHTITLATDTGTEQLQVRLLGGLLPQLTQWQGQLGALDVKTVNFGDWRLLQPADLQLAATGASLGESCLGETNGARLCGSGQWQQDGSGSIKAAVGSLSVSQWLAAVTGDASAELDASLAADGSLTMNSIIRLSEGMIAVELDQGKKLLHHGGGEIEAIIDGNGFKADASFRAPEQGEVDAQLSLPQLKAFPLAEQQPLAGNLRANLPSLEGVAAWIPELSSSSGRLDADLALSGSLEQPQVLGQLLLSEGAAEIPLAGLKLQQIELTAASDKNNPDTITITGAMRSGSGHIELGGQANLADNSVALALEGDRFQIFNTPDARVVLSPELQIDWADNALKLRGDLLIPEASITPQLALSPSSAGSTEQDPVPGQAIAPSRDVVIVNGPVELNTGPDLPEAPFRIDSQIRLLLGDKVDVNAVGFISGISGAVTFTNTPDQVDLVPIATGSFNLDHGTFRAYGQDLDIETGQIIFADVRATEPELNIRAVRWIDDDPTVTVAGVLVTGSLTQPVLDLFSRPQMEPSVVQTYLLTGRSSGSKDNVLSIGTYISPRIYVGYGYNILQRTSEFNSLFSVTPRWGVGADLGEADSKINATFTYER